ncbi:MAG: hypothetical protein QFX35_04860 [Candidatus Verstraetearchaeota archaeon]|nr:hypothetical protein [Candidatus Verstraetearchaeota archaeon]
MWQGISIERHALNEVMMERSAVVEIPRVMLSSCCRRAVRRSCGISNRLNAMEKTTSRSTDPGGTSQGCEEADRRTSPSESDRDAEIRSPVIVNGPLLHILTGRVRMNSFPEVFVEMDPTLSEDAIQATLYATSAAALMEIIIVIAAAMFRALEMERGLIKNI